MDSAGHTIPPVQMIQKKTADGGAPTQYMKLYRPAGYAGLPGSDSCVTLSRKFSSPFINLTGVKFLGDGVNNECCSRTSIARKLGSRQRTAQISIYEDMTKTLVRRYRTVSSADQADRRRVLRRAHVLAYDNTIG